MLKLARGWIPQDQVKLWFSCWRFVPYGPDSITKWLALQRSRTCHKKKKEWVMNWEVQLWLKPWPMPSNRIRCPACVLDDQFLLLTTKSFKSEALHGPWYQSTNTEFYFHAERMSQKYDQQKVAKSEKAVSRCDGEKPDCCETLSVAADLERQEHVKVEDASEEEKLEDQVQFHATADYQDAGDAKMEKAKVADKKGDDRDSGVEPSAAGALKVSDEVADATEQEQELEIMMPETSIAHKLKLLDEYIQAEEVDDTNEKDKEQQVKKLEFDNAGYVHLHYLKIRQEEINEEYEGKSGWATTATPCDVDVLRP